MSGDPTPGDEPEVDDYNITDVAWLDLSDTDAWFDVLTGDEWLLPVLWDLRAELGFGSHGPPAIERLARTPALGVTQSTGAATEQIPALPPGTTIRAAEPHDRGQWAALVARVHRTILPDGLAEWHPGSPDPSHFDHDVAAGAIAVAECDGQLVGTIAASEEHPAEYRSVSWATRAPSLVVHRLMVDPEHRRRGIGTALLHAAAMHAARQGYSACRLDIAPRNRGARTCCERAGYAETAFTRIRSCERICYEKKIGG
jgi:GNAT superfamily N-acetyltransferase